MNAGVTVIRKISSNLISLLAERLYVVVIYLASEGLIARSLSVESYSAWQFSLNIILVASALSYVISSEVIIPALSKYPLATGRLIGSALLPRFIAATCSSLVVGLYALILQEENPTLQGLLIVLSLYPVLSEPFALFGNHFQARSRVWIVSGSRAAAATLRLALIVIATQSEFGQNAVAFGWIRLIESVFTSLVLYLAFRGESITLRSDYRIMRILLTRGASVWPTLLLMILFLRLDKLVLGATLPEGKFSEYAIASQLSEQAFIAVSLVVQSASPVLVFQKIPQSSVLKRSILSALLAGISGLLILACIQQFGSFFIKLVFGQRYVQSADIANSLCLGGVFYAVDLALIQFFLGLNLSKWLAFKWILSATLGGMVYLLYFFGGSIIPFYWISPICFFLALCTTVVIIAFGRWRRLEIAL